MRRKYKRKEGVNPEIIREEERKRRSEPLYMEKEFQRIILLYALMANTSNMAQNIGFGPVIPPILFKKLID